MISNECATSRVFRGALAGAIGGLVGSWAMSQLQAAQQRNPAGRPTARGTGSRAAAPRRQPQKRQQQSGGEEPAVRTAQAISRGFFSHELSPLEKRVAGPAVHYGYGVLVGSLYGTVAELWPGVSAGLGIPYGIALFVLGDEAAAPALHLAPPPTELPAEHHADHLASHVVYGIALDLTRRVARHLV